ncbi:Protein LEG1-like protein [Bienertia sinuspersici]
MVETRRSSSSSKRPLDSPIPASKRPKESEASSSTEEKSVSQMPVEDVAANQSQDPPEVGSADVPPADSPKPSDLNFVEKSSDAQVKDDMAVVDEKETKTPAKRQRLKKSVRSEPAAWAQLISQFSEIFQLLSKDTVPASGLPSTLAILEAQSAPAPSKDSKARGRDSSSSAVAGASILASLSTISKRLSRLPPSKGNDEDSTMGSISGASDNGVCDVDMNDSLDLEDYQGASLNQKEVGPVTDENMNIDDSVKDTGLDTEEGVAPGSNNELRPFLQLLARSSTDFDISGSLSKLLDEQRQLKDILNYLDRPTCVSKRRQEFRETLRKAIISAGDIDASLESFPYYLSETTKNVLLAAAYIPLKCSKMLKYASELPTVCPRILLSGPAGSEIYQETLAKALASILGSTAKDADPPKEHCKPEKASINAKRSSVVASLRHKKLTSSVEADITTGSAIAAPRLPKQEASTASSRKGPAYGNRGKVVLDFKENDLSKIGVRFDEAIPDGNDLGGRCRQRGM